MAAGDTFPPIFMQGNSSISTAAALWSGVEGSRSSEFLTRSIPRHVITTESWYAYTKYILIQKWDWRARACAYDRSCQNTSCTNKASNRCIPAA